MVTARSSLPESTVDEGSSQALWAWAATGRTAESARTAAVRRNGFMGSVSSIGSGLDGDGNGAELVLALGARGRALLGRPLQGDAQHLAAADLASSLDDDLVLTRCEILERRVRGIELDLVGAGGARGAGQAVGGDGERAAGAAPPLAQVLQPLVAFLLRIGDVVPDGQVGGDLLVRPLEPDGDIGLVVLGDVE